MARIIYNDIIPFKGFQAITLLPFIFARKKHNPLDERTINHESIHMRQQTEVLAASAAMLSVLCLTLVSWWWMAAAPFCYYVVYCTEYVVRLFAYGREKDAYRNISFEQEAFANENDFGYLKDRKPFAWTRRLFRKT